ncbi:AIM24 family protein, partial [Klebsiella pneumoniae subsp. pneumoniae]|nr:AIM24 family protein [Klebsiella pneumoniae subsp. pneumoniae]
CRTLCTSSWTVNGVGGRYLYYQVFAQSNNAYLALSYYSPGPMITLHLCAKQYRLNDGAFLALDGTAYYTMETQSIGKALLGGQGGFFVMTTQGQGTLLANAYGSIKKLC